MLQKKPQINSYNSSLKPFKWFFQIKQPFLLSIFTKMNQRTYNIQMMRQSTISKKIFYKGISLKEYMRKSAVLIPEDGRQETLLVDEYNQPLAKIQDLEFLGQARAKYTKFDHAQFSTKVSTTKSIDQEKYFPLQNFRKPMPILKKSKYEQVNCSNLSLKHKQKKNAPQLPLIRLSKNKNIKCQNSPNKQIIKSRLVKRQQCLASRQVSQDSQNQSQTFEKGHKRYMSNKDYVEQVKLDIQLRRNLILKKSDKEIGKGRLSQLKDRSLTSRIRL